jgi:Sec7-like guanine-nucleotide exchange factor
VVEQDAHLVLQTLCKMAMKGGGGDDFQNRNKLLSLELLQNCLESVNYAFTFNFRFFDLIRAYICYILLRASVSSALLVFQVCSSLSSLMLLLYMTLSVLQKFCIMGPTGFSIKLLD